MLGQVRRAARDRSAARIPRAAGRRVRGRRRWPSTCGAISRSSIWALMLGLVEIQAGAGGEDEADAGERADHRRVASGRDGSSEAAARSRAAGRCGRADWRSVSASPGRSAFGVTRRKRRGRAPSRPRGSWRDGAGARPATLGHEALDQPVLQRMERRPRPAGRPARADAAACSKRALDLAELVVDADAQRLEAAGCRIDAGTVRAATHRADDRRRAGRWW